MSLHKLSADNEGKNAVVSTTPLAASVTVDADEIALWVGDLAGASNIANLELQVQNFVNDCLERLREIGTPTSATSQYLTAEGAFTTIVPDKRAITVLTSVVFAVPGTTVIKLYVGDLFQPNSGASVSTALKRILEARQELFGRKAAA